MSRAPVRPELLEWAISRSTATFFDLAEKFPKLEEWLEGERQPTVRQLEEFAKATSTPFGFLFLDEPPEESLPIPHFRTQEQGAPETPSPELLDSFYAMQRRQSWMRDYLREQGQEKLGFVESAKEDSNTLDLADKIREVLGVDSCWAYEYSTWRDALRALRRRMEDIGILVVVNGVVGNNTHRKLDPQEFRGFVLVDKYAPLVFVNGADAKAGQMFTLAHEFAHILLGQSAAFDLRGMQPASNEIEQKCNKIAAEFLVPERRMRKVWPDVKHHENPYQSVARRFKVSEIVAARRALDVGLIHKAAFFDFYEDYKSRVEKRARNTSSGGDFYANQNLRVGRRFASAVYRAAEEGKLLYSEAYRLTQLREATLDRYMSRIRIGEL